MDFIALISSSLVSLVVLWLYCLVVQLPCSPRRTALGDILVGIELVRLGNGFASKLA